MASDSDNTEVLNELVKIYSEQIEYVGRENFGEIFADAIQWAQKFGSMKI